MEERVYCPNCGTWSAQGAAYCWKCGNRLPGEAAVAPPQPPRGATPDPFRRSNPLPDREVAPPEPGAASPPPPGAPQPAPIPPFPPIGQPYATPYPPAGVPAAGNRWIYVSASGLATAITVFATLAAFCFGIGAIASLAGAASDDFDALDVGSGFLVLGVFVALLLVGIPLIAWTRRITGNLLPFQAALELGTGWAIGAWFTPIVNYWFPLRIWNQAWRATTPTIAPPIGWQWKGLPVPPIHVICWVLYQVGFFLVSVGLPSEESTTTAVGYVGFAGGLAVTLAMVLLIIVVRNLTARQDAYARLYLPAIALALPPLQPTGPVTRG
jgi:hypothetical protein